MRINAERLWDSLMEMAKIGATEKGGSSRLALTLEDKEGRALFCNWCEALEMQIQRDKAGNLFARYKGENSDKPPLVMGSHLDTQPKGGRFDGVYGVLAALEVVRTLHENHYQPNRDIEIAVWMNEEGARFSPAMMGSSLFIGELQLGDALKHQDREGTTLQEALLMTQEAGVLEFQREFDSYFELHIEQGPVLEAESKAIGVVTGGQGIAWLDLCLSGRAQHAGTTPMQYRKDALFTLARLMVEIEQSLSKIDDLLVTMGEVSVQNSSRNTIAGHIDATLDIRHPNFDQLQASIQLVKNIAQQVSIDKGVEIAINEHWLSPPIPFDPACIQIVSQAVNDLGLSHREIISGAGHDAIHLAKHCPTTMIFIPCKDGISHNEAESISHSDCQNGANVLLKSILLRDQSLAGGL